MYLKKGLRPGQQIGRKAQVTLELALSLICVFLLLLGSLEIFLWLNERLVQRQDDYENNPEYGRVAAGSSNQEVQVDESDNTTYPDLLIFK